ncbi:MAG: hypothetical protein PHY47_18825 [Lachnospiraceae bacterium]|nr:hypothetical protein [Lachnospiraceae bacterium]
MKYELNNGIEIDFKLKQTDFPHLIGLHKLIDIPVIRQFNDMSNKTVSAKYILFDQGIESGYNHLCVAENHRQSKYAESFFYNPTDLYIRNQTIVKVNKVQIFDKDGALYLEDTY